MGQKKVFRCRIVDDGDDVSLSRVFFLPAIDVYDIQTVVKRLFPSSTLLHVEERDAWVKTMVSHVSAALELTPETAMERTLEEIDGTGVEVVTGSQDLLAHFSVESLESLNKVLKEGFSKAILPSQTNPSLCVLTETTSDRVLCVLNFPMHIDVFYEHLRSPEAL